MGNFKDRGKIVKIPVLSIKKYIAKVKKITKTIEVINILHYGKICDIMVLSHVFNKGIGEY